MHNDVRILVTLVSMADKKAIEYRTEYHKAVLEVEDKYNLILELQKQLRKKEVEESRLQVCSG